MTTEELLLMTAPPTVGYLWKLSISIAVLEEKIKDLEKELEEILKSSRS